MGVASAIINSTSAALAAAMKTLQQGFLLVPPVEKLGRRSEALRKSQKNCWSSFARTNKDEIKSLLAHCPDLNPEALPS